ncbi:MAG: hypothetical protein JSV00_05735 [bacterium]|nr:MAG: hypothetical protein JSV00_05735 [bacterium]
MLSHLLFWIYLLNAVTLIVHEIDSAFWREWELFRIPGGVTGFLVLHFPLLTFVLYGMVRVREGASSAPFFALVLGGAGLFAFFIHFWFIRRGRREFTSPISRFILRTTLSLSLIQIALTVLVMVSSRGEALG